VSCPGREPSPTTSARRAGSLLQESEDEARRGREELLAVLVPHFENGIAVAREHDLCRGGLADPRGCVDRERLGRGFAPGGTRADDGGLRGRAATGEPSPFPRHLASSLPGARRLGAFRVGCTGRRPSESRSERRIVLVGGTGDGGKGREPGRERRRPLAGMPTAV